MNPIASRPSAYAEPPDTWLWGQTLTLSDIVLILRRRLWLAIFPILFLLLPATGLIATTTPLYTAQSTVVVQPNPQQGVPPPREADALAQFQTEVNIITSERLARDAIHKAGLVNRPEFNPTLLEAREKPSILTPIGEAVADAVSALRSLITGGDGGEDGAASGDGEAEAGPDVVDAHVLPLFRERIQVFPLGTSRVIAIQFSSESPKTAAQVANVMAELYITQQIRAKLEAKQVATTWMTDSIAELRQNVEKSERAVEDYRARHGIVEGRNTTLVNDQISTVSSQLLTAKAAAEAAGAKVRGLEGMLSKDGPRAVLETAANPASGALRTQESTLRQRRAELSATYGPSHPLMINNSNEIAAIDGKLRSEATNVIAAARNEASVARQQVQALEASLIQFRAELNTLNQAEVELRALERDATANRTLLEQFLGQLRTKEATSVEQPDAYILSQASVPVEPAGPRRIFLVMGVGVLAGAVWLIMVVIS
ncbi:MAG TPA: GumC family protein, partial [Azospirillaceae bacterium]|nr:GumC family protein [Azospirillaceae bacterium]